MAKYEIKRGIKTGEHPSIMKGGIPLAPTCLDVSRRFIALLNSTAEIGPV
jgi:hypothetical protein